MQVMVPPHGIYPPDYGLGAQRYRGDTFPPGIIGRWNTLGHFLQQFLGWFWKPDMQKENSNTRNKNNTHQMAIAKQLH